MKKFGQHEKLTSRLKRILTGYPFGKEVLKEMVQNADDAGASRIVFIADPREQPAVQIPGQQKWDTIAAPSLCIYNDKPFTKADIEGIQNLGEGSKGQDPLKTGQYGVGFNCVYHVTDTPLLVSEGPEIGKVLCALDPHHMYVPGATANSPGQMFERMDDLAATCPGILDAFLVKEFPLQNSTMFRFPLRTESQAKESKISRKAVTVNQMEELLMNLRNDMMECLLFLNNVSAIEVGHMDSEGNYEKIFGAKLHLSATDTNKRNDFLQAVKQRSLSLKAHEMGIESVKRLSVDYIGQVEDSQGRVAEWRVLQEFGFSCDQEVDQSVQKAYRECELGMLPRAGIAVMLNCNDTSLEQRYREQHRLYCFLPLPIQINLPMHVNGHFALDHESRRDLWHDDNDRGFRSKWNKLLLQDLIAPAYVRLMMYARDNIPHTGNEEDILKQINVYYQLFPRPQSYDSNYLSSLCDAVYKIVGAERCLPVVFPEKDEQVSIEWYKPADCYIDSFCTLSCIGTKTEKYKGLTKTLLRCKFPFLQEIPGHIIQKLEDAGSNLKNIEPADVVKFLCNFRKTSPKLQDLSKCGPIGVDRTLFQTPDNINSLYRYILETKNSQQMFVKHLEGLPLLLTASKHITTFSSKDKVILSNFSDLAVGASSEFVHPLLVESLPPYSEIQHNTKVFSDLTVKRLADILNQSQLKALAESKSCEMKALLEMHPDREAGGKFWLARMWTFLAKWAEVKKEELRCSRKKNHEIERETFQCVSPLHHWCLVPVQKNKDISLIRLDAIGSVLDEYHRRRDFFGSETQILAALKRLGLPRPVYTVLNLQGIPSGGQLMSNWVTSLDKPDGVIFALSEQFNISVDVNEMLTPEEVNAMMEYFSCNLDIIKGVHCAISTLQKLPGYWTVSQKVVNLASRHAYVLPKNIPTVDMEAWTSEGDIVFLQHVEDTKMKKLMEYIGCMFLTVTEVYCQFIFTQFGLLSQKGRDVHIDYVREQLDNTRNFYMQPMQDKARCILLKNVKTLPFIQDWNEDMKTVEHFFDPREDVFVQFEERNKLLPEKYRSQKWYPFLQECGLQHNVTERMFCAFAQSLEGAKIDENFHRKSQALLQCLHSNDQLHARSFLNKIRDIAFVAPYKVNSDHLAIHSQFRQKGFLKPVSFNGSVWQEAEHLAWTNCDIIPGSAEVSRDSGLSNALQQTLGIVTELRLEKVIEHIENISQKLSALSTEDFQQRAKAMEKISAKLVTYLEEKRNSLTPEQLEKLSCLEFCVYIDHIDNARCMVPVRPNQLVLSRSISDELYPYIVNCPPYLYDHKELMKLLGMESILSLHQLARVLEEIYESSAGEKLHPNEHKAAEKAMTCFLSLLEKSKCTFDGDKLYLLCNKGTIHSAKDVLINDNEELYKRIAGLQKYEAAVLLRDGACIGKIDDFQLQRALRQLPSKLKPSLLTECFLEYVDKDETILRETCSELAQELKDRFCHTEFVRSVSRLLEHGLFSKRHEQENQKMQFEDIQSILKGIQVHSTERLVTYLTNTRNEKIEGSSRNRDYFIKKEDDHILLVYVTDETEKELFCVDLAHKINLLFNGGMQNEGLSCLISILRSKVAHFWALFDKFKIPGGSVKRKTINREDAFEPGRYVPVALHHLLVQEILNFSKGEIVAIELDDPINSSDDGDQTAPPTYIFAKIIAQVSTENKENISLGSHYIVRIGQNKQAIHPVTSLYRFERQNPQTALYLPSLNEIKYEVKEQLEEASKLSVKERDNIIKRLILKWHGDTRPRMEDLRPEILSFICTEFKKLLSPDNDCSPAQYSPVCQYRSSRNSCRSFGETFIAGNNWSTMNYLVKRAQEHEAARVEYNKDLDRSRSNPVKRIFSHRGDVVIPNPQLGESRRWLQQAVHDLARASKYDTTDCGTYQWNCTMAYQVRTFKIFKCLPYYIYLF